MKVRGKNILYFPISDLSQIQRTPGLNGIPFLAPRANRLGDQAFWASGKKYLFNMVLGNVRGPVPIHGRLAVSSFWLAGGVVVADNRLVATGEFKPNDFPDPLPLRTYNLDTGFTGLHGRAFLDRTR